NVCATAASPRPTTSARQSGSTWPRGFVSGPGRFAGLSGLSVASWPRHGLGPSRVKDTAPMATRKSARAPKPMSRDAETLLQGIRALGDYEHVSVRAGRGHLNIFVDDGESVARCTPLGAGHYGLSFHTHSGRWEAIPIIADITVLAHDLVSVLGPYLQRGDFPDTKSESHH